ncbi:ABC transporter permease [Chitinophaga nivalis]|uniref:ABC transporter permease n=1 Tax=Chitinophaga nivalis TaxID=2991709 RepID=A0ABT3IMN0_9BACT|nr:ABC transporter permease [Chitinophaga nivalis]MCW3465095.1 ABC transporter permease [Chitinophaga nivalis]MCW3485213.1 ABC transporter permease [Chitinophaga nivalis]
MLKSYFIIAWRRLVKDRQFTAINLMGLSTGLACTLLIYLWVYDEYRMDRFHENDRRLYQVMENQPTGEGIVTSQETPAMLAETLPAIFPEVAYAAVSTPPFWFPQVALTAGNSLVKSPGVFAGKDYFNIFSYPLIAGHKNQVLADKHSIVISEKLALSLFHTTVNVTGKTIGWQIDQFKKYSVVSGVFKDMPGNASVQLDFVMSFEAFRELMNISHNITPGGPFYTYLVLGDQVSVPAFNEKLRSYMSSLAKGPARQMFLQRYADNYLYGKYVQGVQTGGRIVYVRLFVLIALFIILIAGINFMNLHTARATTRMKETGVRKAVGAGRWTLALQYLCESFLLSFLALVIALLLIVLLMPAFNHITGKQLSLQPAATPMLGMLAITVLTGLISGSYPAWYLSGLRTTAVLKGRLPNAISALWTRKGLVIFQFTLSVTFVVAVWVVYRQMDYIQHKSPGYNKNQVISFAAEGTIPANLDGFLAAIKKIPGVVQASSIAGNVQGAPSVGIPWQYNGHAATIQFRPFLVNHDLIPTLGIQMAAGRPFSGDFRTDTTKIIFNEAAIQALGISDPVGKIISWAGVNREIIGVTKDFHFESLYETIKPCFFQLDARTGTILVKLTAGMEPAVIARLEAFYKTYNPGFAFSYTFLDTAYQAQYIAERRMAQLSGYFAGLAVIISLLGLLGLTAYTAERRRREVGIRKVLGASVMQVVVLLSSDFLKAVGLSILLALPLAWWLMSRWLQAFAYHMPMQADVFICTGMAMTALALLTISVQTLQAALANPVKSLDSE